MEAYPIQDAVCKAIAEAGINVDLDQLLETLDSLGVVSVEDLDLVTEDDLKDVIAKVPARRLFRKIKELLQAEQRTLERNPPAETETLDQEPRYMPDESEMGNIQAASRHSQETDQLSSQKGSETNQEIRDSPGAVVVGGSHIGGNLNISTTPQDIEMDNILNDAKNYIPTPALDAALEHLESNSCQTFTGCPGSGKTTLAHMLLKKLSIKGFKPYKLERFWNCSIHSEKFAFLVDDIFGSVGFDEKVFNKCKSSLKFLLGQLNSKRIKLIFTTRLSILKEAKPYLDTISLMFENKNVINVAQKEYMSSDTMKQMLRHHSKKHLKLSEEQIDSIIESFDVQVAAHGFPHCCELLKTYKKAQNHPERFFQTPVKMMKVTLSAIMKEKETIEKLFKTIVSSHGELDLETFEPEDQRSFNESIKNMVGTFLKLNRTIVAFRHPFLYECVSSVIGENDPAFILRNAKISYLTFHVVVKKSDESEAEDATRETDDTVMMTVKLDRHIHILRGRFVSEIKEQCFTMIFQHHMWRNKDFVSKSFDQILEDDCLQTLMCYRGTKQSAFHWFARSKSDYLYLDAFSRDWPINEDLKLDAIYGCLVWSNVNGLRSILTKEPTNLERRKFDGKSVLAHVASVGSSEICSYLVEEQLIDPTQEDPDGKTALHWAAAAGNRGALRVFQKAGCDVNAKNFGDMTPLHFAVIYEHPKMAKLLVENSDCDVDICTTMLEGMDTRSRELYIDHSFSYKGITDGTPLLLACLIDNPEIVKILLNAQADALKENPIGQTPFHYACIHENAKCLCLLVDKYKHDAVVSKLIFAKQFHVVNAREINRVRSIPIADRYRELMKVMRDFIPFPFEMAIRNGNWKAVSAFLSLKPEFQRLFESLNNHPITFIIDNEDLQKPLFDGYRVEHFVALSANVSLMTNLLKYKNSKINEPSACGWTPFHLGLMTGNPDMTTLLLEAGADVNIKPITKMPILSLTGRNGTVELVQSLLDKGVDIHEASPSGETFLFTAVTHGLHDIVDLLLNKEAVIDGTPDALATPLHVACRIGDEKCVEYLINKNASLNAFSFEGMTPLHLAAFSDNREIVSLLIKGGADLNAKSELHQLTALHQASTYGYFDIAKQLLKAGADPEIKDEEGYTSLCLVAVFGHESILHLHFEHQANLYHHNNEKQTPLMLSIMNDHSSVAKQLIEKSKQLNPESSFDLVDSDGFTALHHACDCGHIDITQALLSLEGINVNSLSAIEGTPLMVASKHGFVQIVNLLLNAKTDVNLTTDYGMSPLFGACKNGHLEVVRSLVQGKSDVNINYMEGKTPLMVACERGHQAVVEYLLQSDGNVSLPDTVGYSALHWACTAETSKVSVSIQEQDNDQNIIDLLVQYGAEVDEVCDPEKPVSEENKRMFGSPLTLASAQGHVHFVRSLLRYRASSNQGRFFPLYSAARHGHAAVVNMLIEAGADVNVQVDYAEGRSPLIIASIFGHDLVVNHLVKAGACTNFKDNIGRTALHWACSGNRVAVVIRLLQIGNHPSKHNNETRTAHDMNEQDNEARTGSDVNVQDGGAKTGPNVNEQDKVATTVQDENIQDHEARNVLDVDVQDNEARIGHGMDVQHNLIRTTLDLNSQDETGNTALLTSVKYKHTAIVRLLAGSGADLNQSDNRGVTPLHAAAKSGSRDIVQILVENGAMNDAIDFIDGQTPLSLAVEEGYLEVVQFLLNQGSDVNIVDFCGLNALCRAVKRNRVDIVLEMVQYDVDKEILKSAVRSSTSEMMRDILLGALTRSDTLLV